jgi:putative ABC transport system permease protein
VRAVMRDGLGLVLIGIAGGAVIALLLGRLLEPLLYQTSPRDPVVLAGVIATLLAASVAAVLLPARRATRVDPVVALRSD